MKLDNRLFSNFLTSAKDMKNLIFGLIVAVCIFASTSNLTAARLNIFEKSAVSQVLEKNKNSDLATNRKALKKIFPRIRNKHKHLAGLSNMLRDINTPRAQHLLAFTLMSDKKYKSALTVLTDLAAKPNPDSWVTAELARLSQIIELQTTFNLMGRDSELAVLSDSEKDQVNEILKLKISDARTAMKELSKNLLKQYGDLTPLVNYLKTGEPSQNKKIFTSVAALSNGNIVTAETALRDLVKKDNIDTWVIFEYGRIKEMLGKIKQAANIYKRALKSSSDPAVNYALTIRLAQIHYDSDEPKKASQLIRNLTKQKEFSSIEVKNYCARLAALYGDHELSVELFTPTGKNKKLYLNLLFHADALLNTGNLKKAHLVYEKALTLAKLPRDKRYVLDRIINTARKTNSLEQVVSKWTKEKNLAPEQVDILVNLLGGELGQTDKLFAFTKRTDLPAKTIKYLKSPALQERLAVLGSVSDSSWNVAEHYLNLMKQYPDEPSYRDGYVRLLLMEGKRKQAIKVYTDAIASNKSSAKLMEVATGARTIGLMDIARDAATKSGIAEGESPFQSSLFNASLYREQGESDKALEILHKLKTTLKPDNAAGMMILSSEFERLDDIATSTTLCQQAYKISQSENTLRKLITLLEEQGRNVEAFDLWKKLWKSAEVPMTIIQANNRLLELGARNGKLADIAIELEDKLAAEGLNQRELSLLLDIYTSVGDPVSAADVLLYISKTKGDGIVHQNRLLKVYMKSELFGKCNKILRKLIEIDPKNRDEHLQLLAIIALEKGNSGDAMVVLEELAKRNEDGVLRDSFSASVLNMLGKNSQAASAYRRGLADNPDDVESWLLWGNALADRDKKEREALIEQNKRAPKPQNQSGNIKTRALFTMMLEEAEADDLFVICVDGLLNARAPRQSILNALRRLNARLADKPHNLLLHRLAADLNEDINRPEKISEILNIALTVAGDSRPFIMRELITMAKNSKQIDVEIRHGRALLNITEHLPPAESLALGSMLMKRGFSAEAEVAFQRVINDPNAVGTASDIASLYENSGLFEKAAKVIKKLLINNPFDIELHIRLALLEEKNGNFTKANTLYSKAIDIMSSKLPRRISSAQKNNQKKISLTDIDQYYNLTVKGLIATSRSPELQKNVINDIQQSMQEEINNLTKNKTIEKNIALNPRLNKIASLLRHVSFIFHHAEIADNMDTKLFKLFPNDSNLRNNIYTSRDKWQNNAAARAFMQKLDPSRKRKSVVSLFAEDKKTIEQLTNDPSLTDSERSIAITLLSMYGHDELIESQIKNLDISKTPISDSEQLVTAGIASNNPSIIRDAILTNLTKMRTELEGLAGTQKGRAYLRPTKLYKQIIAAWPILSKQDKATAVNIYGMIVNNEEKVYFLSLSYHYLLSITGRANEISPKHIQDYVLGRYLYEHAHVATVVSEWIKSHPKDQYANAISKLIIKKPKNRFNAISVNDLARFISPELITPEIIKTYPPLANYSDQYNTQNIPETLSNDEMYKLRIQYASEIKNALIVMNNDVRKLFPLHDITIRKAANRLSKSHIDILSKDYIKSKDPFEKIVAFLLLKHSGRDIEAFNLLKTIAAMPPEADKVQSALSALPVFLKAYGWNIPALKIIKRNSSSPNLSLNMNFLRQDPLAILDDDQGDILDIGARRIYATSLMSSPLQLKQAVQIYQTDTRQPHINLNFRNSIKALTWPARLTPNHEGLIGLNQINSDSVLHNIANLQDGQDQLYFLMRSIQPKRYSREKEMCDQIAMQAAKKGLSPLIKKQLTTAANKSSLNVFDFKLIESLAKLAPKALPKELNKQINDMLLQSWYGNTKTLPKLILVNKRLGSFVSQARRMATFANASKYMGEKNKSTSFGRWSIALDILEDGCPQYIDSYLKSIPADKRKETLKNLLPFLGLHEARDGVGKGFSKLLNILIEQGYTDIASQQVDKYLQSRLHIIRRKNVLPGISNYETIIGGYSTDYKIKDDGVAAALARLNRPDDYQRLLWKKNKDSVYIRSAINVSMSVSPMNLIDNTGSLPDPSQVDNINTYLDIHRKIINRLRSQGLLDIQSQVTSLCILGQWCIKYNLTTEANKFLQEAEKLSKNLLTGKLAVSDLQRLLKKDDLAKNAEINLLKYDLLPIPRLPHTLKNIKEKYGQNKANFEAYRQSRFTNNPEVLELSLKHVENEKLKAEFLNISERIRLVKTLFLPEDAPSPFKGFSSIPEWMAAIEAKASKLPSKLLPKKLSSLPDDGHPAIALAFTKGNDPQVIYVPIIHDDDYSHLAAEGTSEIKSVMDNCEQISDHLYNRYGVRNIQLEGLSKQFVTQYNNIPVQRRNWMGKGQGMVVHQTWGKLLSEKAWTLLPASDRPLVGPLTAMGRRYEAKIVKQLDRAKVNGWFKNQQVYDKNKDELMTALKSIAEEYNTKLDALLKEDPKLKREYDITVTQRNKAFLDYLLAPKKPGIVFFGAAHWQDLEEQLNKKGLSYAVIVPTGVSWPPTKKDEDTIFSDMLELGVQLKNCTLELGDGNKAKITIPVK